MACRSKVGANIKKEHTDTTHSSQQFVHSSRVLQCQKEIKRELSPAPSLPTVQVCPINIVQGDSILVKLKYKEGILMPITAYGHSVVNNRITIELPSLIND